MRWGPTSCLIEGKQARQAHLSGARVLPKLINPMGRRKNPVNNALKSEWRGGKMAYTPPRPIRKKVLKTRSPPRRRADISGFRVSLSPPHLRQEPRRYKSKLGTNPSTRDGESDNIVSEMPDFPGFPPSRNPHKPDFPIAKRSPKQSNIQKLRPPNPAKKNGFPQKTPVAQIDHYPNFTPSKPPRKKHTPYNKRAPK